MVAVIEPNSDETQKPMGKDITKNRRKTDKYWCPLYIVILLIWLGGCAYLHMMKNDPRTDVGYDCSENVNSTVDVFTEYLRTSIFNIVRIEQHFQERGMIVVYANVLLHGIILVYALSEIYPTSKNSHYWVHFTGVLYIVNIFSVIFRALMYDAYYRFDPSQYRLPWDEKFLYWTIPEYFVILIDLAMLLIIVLRRGPSRANKNHTPEPICFYLFHKCSLLFGLLIYFIIAFIVLFTFALVRDCGEENFTTILQFIIFSGSVYMLMVVYYFGVAVLSLTTASNYWAESKENITFYDVSRAVVIIWKYHLGSIVFNATLILPMGLVIFMLLRSMYQWFRTKSKKICVLRRLFFIGEYSTIITAISGTNFYHATKRVITFPKEGSTKAIENKRYSTKAWLAIAFALFSSNSLVLIFKWWCQDDDPSFTSTSIFAYLWIICTCMPLSFLIDVIRDTITLCDAEKNEVKQSTSSETPVELAAYVPGTA